MRLRGGFTRIPQLPAQLLHRRRPHGGRRSTPTLQWHPIAASSRSTPASACRRASAAGLRPARRCTRAPWCGTSCPTITSRPNYATGFRPPRVQRHSTRRRAASPTAPTRNLQERDLAVVPGRAQRAAACATCARFASSSCASTTRTRSSTNFIIIQRRHLHNTGTPRHPLRRGATRKLYLSGDHFLQASYTFLYADHVRRRRRCATCPTTGCRWARRSTWSRTCST